MVVTGNWADILNPSMRKIYDDVYSRFPEEYSKVFHLMTSDRNYEKFSSSTGFGMANDVDEGEEIPSDDPVQGFDSTFTHKKIGKAFIVSRETLEDDLFNVIAAKPKQLASGLRRKVEQDAAVIFNSANATTYNTGADGVALATASHPREDGGTVQSNYNSNQSLTEAGIEAAVVAMAGWLDGKGQKILVNPDLLVVPVAKDLEARVLIQSLGRTGTTHLNEINPYQSRFDIFVYHWLTDVKNWFLIDRQWDFLKFIWRRTPTLEQDDKVSNDIARWYSTARYSYGWTDWRFIYVNVASS